MTIEPAFVRKMMYCSKERVAIVLMKSPFRTGRPSVASNVVYDNGSKKPTPLLIAPDKLVKMSKSI